MNKQNFDVNKLRVASACPTSWNTMRGDDKKRFCDLCELSVYNFSEMTEAEIFTLTANSNGRVCGRLYRRADGTVITKDCPVGIRSVRKRMAKYGGAVFATLLGLFTFSFAQTKEAEKCESNTTVTRKTVVDGNAKLSGIVMDPQGAVIPGTKITLINAKGKIYTVKSDDNGIYYFNKLKPGKFDIKFELFGFNDQEVKNVVIGKDEDINVEVKMLPSPDNVIINVEPSVTVGIVFGTYDDSGTSIEKTIRREKLLKLPINK